MKKFYDINPTSVNKFKEVAIIRRNAYGDLICALPLINYIKKQNPDIRITLFLQKQNYPLAKYLANIDQVIMFDAVNKYVSAIKLKFLAWGKKFDCAIGVTSPAQKLMTLCLSMLNAQNRVAYSKEGMLFSRFINIRRNLKVIDMKSQYTALTVLQLINPDLTSIEDSLWPKFFIPTDLKSYYEKKIILRLDSKYNKKIFLASLTNNREHSTLSLCKMTEALNRTQSLSKCLIVLSCMEKDVEKAKYLHDKLSYDSIILPTKSFDEFIALLSMVDYKVLPKVKTTFSEK